MKLITVTIIILSVCLLCSSAFTEEACKNEEVQIFLDHRDVLRLGAWGITRQRINGVSSVIGIRIGMGINETDILWQHGLRNGDLITKFCGVEVGPLLTKSMGAPACCDSDYPTVLTLTVQKLNKQVVELKIPYKED